MDKQFPKNALERWLQPWFLVEGGFADSVLKKYSSDRGHPNAALSTSEKKDVKTLEKAFEDFQLSLKDVLSEKVLAKAGISSLPASQDSFSKFLQPLILKRVNVAS